MSELNLSELNWGLNAGLVEELFTQYLDNPASVDPTWRAYFDQQTGANQQAGRFPRGAYANGTNGHAKTEPSSGGGEARLTEEIERAFEATPHEQPDESTVLARAAIRARVYQLLNAYRVRGHLYAHLDPLGQRPAERAELALSKFSLSEEDLDRVFPTVDLPGPPVQTLREIIDHLEETYCRSIGVEFTHIEDLEARNWLQERMESSKNRVALSREHQARILAKLTEAEVFEQFVHGSYGAGTKRFSLEGAESMMPLLDLLIERAGEHHVEEIVLGMAHRGRLNVLVNIMNKNLREIFAAFEDTDPQAHLGGGDVKYHLGYSTDRLTELSFGGAGAGNRVHLTLTFNPSHLEFVNPVVEGRVRAKQDRRGDDEGSRVMPLLIHGDAAFIGQGVVAETLNLVNLAGYKTGGTIHLIVNNQIGFTTDPSESRSTRYASDITRMLKVPVFHVNGEDPEAVAQVALLAIDYRQRFKQDVVIDMYCYRKYGHNEGDEPRYTQPRMYQKIDQKPTVRKIYVEELVKLGHLTVEEADAMVQRRRDALSSAFTEVKTNGFTPGKYSMGGVWKPYKGGPDTATPKADTAVSRDKLITLSEKLLAFPEGFKPHPKVLPTLKQRHEKLVSGEPFDWGTAEALAFATLLDEGAPVRLSGQDVRRGTFSHRHCVLFDAETGKPFAPLSAVCQGEARFEAHNSPLSEAGVLGFEFGYSLDYPDGLVIWEAQFGDFLNGAQVIVDQFITSCEDKWHRLSGLVLLLPHGYEGQGPEHSSARLERFLQNCAEDNIQVVNLTTPAQLFHALRRQIVRPWRKPLVVMTPKSLLRVAATSKGPHRPVSTIDDLASGGFQNVIGDTAGIDPKDVKKVILTTGKVYYDLALEREARGIKDTAILRVEQLYPLGEELRAALEPYVASNPRFIWAQEEPENFGAWYFMNAFMKKNAAAFLGGASRQLEFVGRFESASPATGSRASHLLEQKKLLDEAFG
ncbi:MAG: 2-oxoglutarate dehydrogenase E1 component [Polyangiaceae bacterium]